MGIERFYCLEVVLVIGGVALVAFLQVDLFTPKVSHVFSAWIRTASFGAIYAVIGGATTFMAVTRQRDSKMASGRGAR